MKWTGNIGIFVMAEGEGMQFFLEGITVRLFFFAPFV